MTLPGDQSIRAILLCCQVVTHQRVLLAKIQFAVVNDGMRPRFANLHLGLETSFQPVLGWSCFDQSHFTALIAEDQMAIDTSDRCRSATGASNLAAPLHVALDHVHTNRKTV